MAEKLIKRVTVEKENLASYVGSGTLNVLATPSVIAFMEGTAAELAQNILNNSGLTTVGMAINIKHTSPTPLGAEVEVEASLVKTDGRFFEFEVSARDKAGEIAKGAHTRVSVKADKFQKKADGKFDEI